MFGVPSIGADHCGDLLPVTGRGIWRGQTAPPRRSGREFVDGGLDVTIIRPRTIMGHGRLGIMQLVFEWIHQGRNVFVLGRGDNRYQFVHADDLAEACLLAAESARLRRSTTHRGGGLWHLALRPWRGSRSTPGPAAGSAHSPYRRDRRGSDSSLTHLRISPLAPYHWLVYGKDVYFDVAEAREELGWRPRWGNIDMFINSYEWYLSNRTRILEEKGRSPHRSAVKEGVLKALRWF